MSEFMSASFNNVKYIIFFALNNNSKALQLFMLFFESVQNFTIQNYVKINFNLFKQFMKNYSQILLIKKLMIQLEYALLFETSEPPQLLIPELFEKIYKLLNCKIKNNDIMRVLN